MKHRKLRIAGSVVCGTVTLLLVALWVCSYWNTSGINGSSPANSLFLRICSGKMWFGRCASYISTSEPWGFYHSPLIESAPFADRSILGVAVVPLYGVWQAKLPLWFPTLLSAGLAAWIPRARFRFTVRSLLITMAMVAMVLGLVVYAVRYSTPYVRY
jgi:hypothetical protein